MADGRHIENRFLAITQQQIAIFQWNFEWEVVFPQIYGYGTYFVFLLALAVWASARGGFRIVSDTLVMNRYRLKLTNY